MPELGGMDLDETIHVLRPNLPIIAMSGMSGGASTSLDIQAIKAVVSALIIKPFKTDDLLTLAHQLLQRAEKS